MIEILLKSGIIAASTLILCVTWIYRGGSLHWDWLPSLPRFFDLLATPLFISVSVAASLWPLTLYQWIALVAGMLVFTGAQAPGWGRQMDLGRDAGRDDEWGWQIRDWIFGKEEPILDEAGNHKIDWKGRKMHKGSYARDLTGLYMRFVWFLFAAPAWYFVDPLIVLIPVLVFLGSPLIWALEYRLYNHRGEYGSLELYEAIKKDTPIGSSWVEFWVSVWIAVITGATSVALMLL